LVVTDVCEVTPPTFRDEPLNIKKLVPLPSVKSFVLLSSLKYDASLPLKHDGLSTRYDSPAIHCDWLRTRKLGIQEPGMVDIGSRLHIRCFVGEIANHLLWCSSCMHVFFQVSKGLDEEQGGDVRLEEIVEPHRLIRVQTLQR